MMYKPARLTHVLRGGVACAIAQRVGVADRRGVPKLAERLPETQLPDFSSDSRWLNLMREVLR